MLENRTFHFPNVMKKLNLLLASIFGKQTDIGTLLLRILVGFHLLYAVHGVLFSSTAMKGVVGFFDSQHIIFPAITAPLTAWTEAICACLFIVGIFTRMAAVAMIIVFVNALVIVHIGHPYPEAFPALVMLVGSVHLLCNGAGKYSLDAMVKNA
jgi:putative oxidoreductase